MGRNSKYSKELVDIICEAITTQGGDEPGWIAGGIAKSTFYKWMEDHPDFSDAVEKARKDFQKRCPQYQKDKALEKLTDALENGHIIRWKTHRRLRKEHWVPGKDGQPDYLKWYQQEEEETEHTETRPTPQWAIERIIPKPMWTMEQLIAVANEYGLQVTVKDADLFNRYIAEIGDRDNQGDTGAGITEETAEQIRGRILGLEG